MMKSNTLTRWTRCYSTKNKISNIWVITDGIKGNENQSMALANSFGVKVNKINLINKEIFNKLPMVFNKWIVEFSKHKKDEVPFYLKKQDKETLNFIEKPSLVISSGKQTILASLYLRKVLGPVSFFTHIGYPNLPFNNFDAVVLMKHELLKMAHLGPALSQQKNMIVTPLAMHNITPQLISKQSNSKILGKEFTQKQNDQPIVAFLMGHIPQNFSFLNQNVIEMIDAIELLVTRFNAKVIISHSERSPEFVRELLKRKLTNLINQNYPIYIYDPTKDGTNPYLSILYTATHFVVPSGSINLISEALSTRKPVYLLNIERSKKEIQTLANRLVHQKFVRPFRVSNNYFPPGDPLSFIGEHKPFELFKDNSVDKAKNELMELIENRFK